MTHHTLDDILPFVERPSRYLGSEINTIKKDRKCILHDIAYELFAVGIPCLSSLQGPVVTDVRVHQPEIGPDRMFNIGLSEVSVLYAHGDDRGNKCSRR